MVSIRELAENIDREVSARFLLTELTDSMNRFSNRWQDGILSDRTGDMQLRIWNENIMPEYHEYVGHVVEVLGKVTVYQKRPIFELISMRVVEDEDVTMYLVSINEEQKSRCISSILRCIEQTKESIDLHRLLSAVFSDSTFEKMAICPGGCKHSSYLGGLLVHTADVASRVSQICETQKESFYPTNFFAPVAIAGALLHDIGKLFEFETIPFTRLNTRGWLVSTPVDSILYVNRINGWLKDQSVKNLTELYHVILTASSDKDDKVQPRTLEAIMVNGVNREIKELDMFGKSFYDSERSLETKEFVHSSGLKRTIYRRPMV